MGASWRFLSVTMSLPFELLEMVMRHMSDGRKRWRMGTQWIVARRVWLHLWRTVEERRIDVFGPYRFVRWGNLSQTQVEIRCWKWSNKTRRWVQQGSAWELSLGHSQDGAARGFSYISGVELCSAGPTPLSLVQVIAHGKARGSCRREQLVVCTCVS